VPCDALNERSTATKTGEKDRSCAEAGCRKGACVDGIVVQHSWLWSWLCGEQGMLLQHCIASSGVVMAPQSIAYRAIATAMTLSNIGFIRRMSTKVCASNVAVKTGCRGPLGRVAPLYLSWIALSGLLANAIFCAPGADPLAALALVPLIAREAWQAIHASGPRGDRSI
jgi:hypothetical protein